MQGFNRSEIRIKFYALAGSWKLLFCSQTGEVDLTKCSIQTIRKTLSHHSFYPTTNTVLDPRQDRRVLLTGSSYTYVCIPARFDDVDRRDLTRILRREPDSVGVTYATLRVVVEHVVGRVRRTFLDLDAGARIWTEKKLEKLVDICGFSSLHKNVVFTKIRGYRKTILIVV